MPETLLLDTTVVVDLLRGNATTVAAVGSLESHFLPSVTVGELYHGAYRSTRVLENARQIEVLIATCEVLPCDDDTARQYGHLKHVLDLRGRPLPENDVWIAALALQHDLPVATFDAHFRSVPGLRTVSWT